MKKLFSVLVLFLITVFIFSSCENVNEPISNNLENEEQSVQKVENRYIVVFKESNFKGLGKTLTAEVLTNEVLESHNIVDPKIKYVYESALKGFTVDLTDDKAEELKTDDRIKYIEKDQLITLGKPPWAGGGSNPPAQVIPWGITRVGGGATYNGNNVAWIIDTGIDLDHPDLNVDVARSKNFDNEKKSADDDNGHGTHVAGTIAAIDNDSYVVGVAAGATVVAVKVLNRQGSGWTSNIIAGVDYVAANGSPGDVANMSLGGGVNQALDDAVANAAATGIKFSLAAGNESDDANNHSPARVNGANIYTVSAFDNNDVFAYFSNYGNPPIDFGAPGVDVFSLYKDGGTATMSGTSMAAPHVAGLLLLGKINTDGYVSGDPDGNPDPIAHN